MSFDKIIKDKLEQFEAPANNNAWAEFSAKLNATNQTPFMGPLVGGIAATVALTALFVSLPDLNEESEIERSPIAIENTTTHHTDVRTETISATVEHVAQESHVIDLVQVDDAEIKEIASVDGTETKESSSKTEDEHISERKSSENRQVESEEVIFTQESINFTAKGIQCPNSEITFTAQLEKDAKVTWIFDGVVVKNGLQVKHAFSDAGTYQTRMIVDFKDGNEQALTQTIEVYENPQSEFSIDIDRKEQCFDQGLMLEGTPSSKHLQMGA